MNQMGRGGTARGTSAASGEQRDTRLHYDPMTLYRKARDKRPSSAIWATY